MGGIGRILIAVAAVLSIDPAAGARAEESTTPGLAPAESFKLPEVDIVGVSPVLGTGVPVNRVPSNVQTLKAKQIEADHPQALTDALNTYVGSVTLSNTEGNPFQQDLEFRGFTASPVLGTPQGLAVYQNGVRVNQPFGDVVFWDLIPTFAVNKLQIIPGSNPVFGLNALGGAVTLEMKNGFNFQGAQLDASGGSFGRRQVVAEYGQKLGDVALYSGFEAAHEDGWRDFSPSDLLQSFSDLAMRRDNFDLGLSLTLGATSVTGNGAMPAQEIAIDRSAVFTIPDNARDRLIFLQGRGNYQLTDPLSLQGNAYFRHSGIHTSNGDTSGFGPCTQPGDNPKDLCNNPGAGETPLTTLTGKPIAAGVGGSAIIGVQSTVTDGIGGSLQTTYDQGLFGRDNTAILGASFDSGSTDFSNGTGLGNLYPLQPIGFGTRGLGIPLGGVDFNTVLDTVNRYYGLYGSDTMAITDALSGTVSGRLNVAQVDLSDHFGIALDGNHTYAHFNPAAGLTYQVDKGMNLYASVGEANRIPTAAELSCANPTQPCRFPAGFISDPALRQVVARTGEFGARGHVVEPVEGHNLSLDWSADVYGTRNANDIIFVAAGPFIGSGYFANAGTTQRLGAEASLSGTWDKVDFYASYGFVRATFESHLGVLSPDNPGANAAGDIFVKPGDRMPGIPLHSGKVGVGYHVTDAWRVELDAVLLSSQFLKGDEANLQQQLPGYAVVNFRTSYQVTKNIELYFEAENILNHNYNSFGVYADPTGDGAFPGFSNPRFYTPGQPFGVWGGIRVRF